MAQGTVDANGVELWYETLEPPDVAPDREARGDVLLISGADSPCTHWKPGLIDGLTAKRVRLYDVRHDT